MSKALVAALSVFTVLASSVVNADESEFARTTIDLGIVVKDIDASAKFYTEVVGLTEAKGFSVPAGFATDVGLTDNKGVDIRVFVLGEEKSATNLKLMQLPGVESKTVDNKTIHASLGYSYITVHVTDMNAAMARMKKAGVPAAAKGPVALPKGFPEGIYLTVIRDPDGNLVELVGPKK